MRPMFVICPRECPSPGTEHCYGMLPAPVRCRCCGRFMPLDEAIELPEDWDGLLPV